MKFQKSLPNTKMSTLRVSFNLKAEAAIVMIRNRNIPGGSKLELAVG